MMQFDEFVRLLDDAVRAKASAGRRDGGNANEAVWSARTRSATVTLVPPLNVSVALREGEREGMPTTWYPVDAALVPVVSNRIAGFLGEA